MTIQTSLLVAIRSRIEIFRWQKHHGILSDPNKQVEPLNEAVQKIYLNFIPNKIKTTRPHQAPWITDKVKKFLRK